VIEAFGAQRRRFVEFLRDLPEPAWRQPSRCSDWSVHEVARHVRDGALAHTAGLAGRPSPFGGGRFDPARTPSQWLARSAGESPADTLRDLTELADRETELLTARLADADGEPGRGPFGRPAHWSIRSLHVFWDAWLHERDVVLPLGAEIRPTDVDLQLAVLYSLLAAATSASWTGQYLRTSLVLDGSPSGGYTISSVDDEIVVAAEPGATAALRAEVTTLLDSLAGRGPSPTVVLGSSTPAAEQLGMLRRAFSPR
jgi:uncharacterized protein (TIGR03083 family)